MHDEAGEREELDAEAPRATPSEHIERVLGEMVAEPMLRTVLLVLVAHAGAFLAPVMLRGLRDGSLPGMAGLALLLGLTLAGLLRDWRARRLRALTGCVLASWTLGVGFAFLAIRYDIW